jgi:hypothetical protein
MWVGGVLSVSGATAILLALLRVAMSASGLARARSFPPSGVVDHAAEVHARMRSRYMARTWRDSGELGRPAFDRTLANDGIGVFRPFRIREPGAQPIAAMITRGAELSITRLPSLNESLRRRLATRVPAAAAAPTPRSRKKPRRKARRSRKVVAA